MQLSKLLTRRNSGRRLIIASLVPFVLLILDLVSSPILIDTSVDRPAAALGDLLQNGSVSLGTLRGHHIFVSIDDINEHDFLSGIAKGRSALLITAFGDASDKEDPVLGPLTEAVESRLQPISSDDYLRLRKIPEELRGAADGHVQEVPLHIPSARYRDLPLDLLLVVTLPPSGPATDDLRTGFKRAFTVADEKSIANVIVPGLGLKWRNSQGASDTPLPEYFSALFNAIPAAQQANNLYISLYKAWPTLQLEEAVSALDSAWEDVTSRDASSLPIHNRNTRLLEIFLLPCLLSCGVFVRLTFVRLIIITTAFFAVGLGLNETIEKLAAGKSEDFRLSAYIAALAVMAFFFPIITQWDVKDLFKHRGRTP